MVVIALDCANVSLRGILSRWLLEIKPGVFVGNVTTSVREELWESVVKGHSYLHEGSVMAFSTNGEQGFDLLCAGDPKRHVIDLEGIKLVKTLKN